MTGLVIDASVAIKWVAPEALSEAAVALLDRGPLVAPDILVAECANILWKKVIRGDMDRDTSVVAANALERVDIELVPMRLMLAESLKLSLDLDHPAYDCLYLAVALARGLPFVTADVRLVNKLRHAKDKRFAELAQALSDAPAMPG